jgi:quercetin dioxygenase-like cupin family protein
MKSIRIVGVVLAAAAAVALWGRVAVGSADEKTGSPSGAAAEHRWLTPADLKWVEASSLPPGCKLAVLTGDLTKPGPFTMRVQFPDGCKLPPHTHPVDEYVTVLSGTLHLGVGGQFDRAKTKALPAGSFAMTRAGTKHFGWTEGATIVQAHAVGPWGISYLNPADDPRNK